MNECVNTKGSNGQMTKNMGDYLFVPIAANGIVVWDTFELS